MMAWQIVNAAVRIAVTFLFAYKLWRYSERYTDLERIGMGVAGGSCLLTLGAIWSRGHCGLTSPYDDWSGVLFAFGVLLTSYARLRREDFGYRDVHPDSDAGRMA